MDTTALRKKFERLSEVRICVIGDVMLDMYTYGKVERISAEAPVPVIQIEKEMSVLGGAGNVLANMATIGVGVTLVSTVGNDVAGGTVRALLAESTGAQAPHLLVADDTKPTIVKKRIVASNQQLLRIDTEDTSLVSNRVTFEVVARLEALVSEVDAICISDYGKGFISAPLMEMVMTIAARRKIPVVVDTKPKNISFFYNCTLISPNESELMAMTDAGTVEERAHALAQKTKSNILVTLGGKGVYYADSTDSTRNFSMPSFATDVRDVSGAGDTVIAFAVIGLALGLSMVDAVTLANHAAAISVSKPHTAVVTQEELLAVL
jgi:D-beta-D-heptose 7-phosphate kinase/D-beta-D-heptose 1-phosphate adenosyltransferase